jgi:hypothetical protein
VAALTPDQQAIGSGPDLLAAQDGGRAQPVGRYSRS